MLLHDLYISTSMKSDDVKQLNLMIPLRVKQSGVYTLRLEEANSFSLYFFFAVVVRSTQQQDSRKRQKGSRQQEREREAKEESENKRVEKR